MKLWIPLEVEDFTAASDFYGGKLGLPLIDRWERPGELGAIYALGDARIEIVQTDTPTQPPSTQPPSTQPPPIAIELSTWDEVDAFGHTLRRNARVFPRGHYGLVTQDPDGNDVLLWSEAPA